MIHSTYQIALFDTVENQPDSIVVGAVAGSGKTTTIVEACNRLASGLQVLFLAFNVKIVNELKSRLPKRINCRTFNSCGWGAWLRYTGKKNIRLEKDKTWGIIRNRFNDSDKDTYGAFVNKMVALAKSSGLRPDDSDDMWFEVQEHHDVILANDGNYNRAIELSKKTLAASIAMAYQVCDFDDQIYMPWLENVGFDKYDIVFVDELQDTSEVQAQLLKRMLRPGGRLVGVGDKRQAIYGFRGAGINSMDLIQKTFNARFLPLSISYRCCKAVVREAQRFVPEIEAFENAPEGAVEVLDKYDVNTFLPDDAIICRNTAPLVEMAYSFITRGQRVNFIGRDIGGGLRSLINNMEADNLDDLSFKLNAWFEREAAKLEAKHQEDKIDLLNDRVKCIEIFISYLPESKRTIQDLLTAIDSLFNSNDKGVTLCTVHKSKGLEWNRVFILDFHLMPSPYAKRDWQKVQENNLIYVAITRAKNYLGYISSKGWKDQPNLGLVFSREKSSESIQESKPRATQVPKETKVKMVSFNPFK